MWWYFAIAALVIAAAFYIFRESIGDAKAVIAGVLENHSPWGD